MDKLKKITSELGAQMCRYNDTINNDRDSIIAYSQLWQIRGILQALKIYEPGADIVETWKDDFLISIIIKFEGQGGRIPIQFEAVDDHYAGNL